MYIEASLISVNKSGEPRTYFEIFIHEYVGTLPDDVGSIEITGPSGVLPYSKEDFSWNNNIAVSNQFFLSVSGAPEEGLYTFSLTIGADVQENTDTQGAILDIPVPTLIGPTGQVAEGDIDFTWEAVTYAGDKCYGIQIYDVGGNLIINRNRVLDSLSHEENLSVGDYTWRVVVEDAPSVDWPQANNRSNSIVTAFEVIA